LHATNLTDTSAAAATCAAAATATCRHFNVVVIDEATQATEPATLVPLMQGAQCAVMAGDPRQLPPTIISREAYKFDLDVTLFDRLQQGVGLAPLLLDTQYRMNPAISCFPRWVDILHSFVLYVPVCDGGMLLWFFAVVTADRACNEIATFQPTPLTTCRPTCCYCIASPVFRRWCVCSGQYLATSCLPLCV
jgi:hypothetical protein